MKYKSRTEEEMMRMSEKKNNTEMFLTVGQFFYVAASIHHIASDLV